MTADMRSCPICKLDNASISGSGVVGRGRDTYEIECKRCGRFGMEGILVRLMEQGQLGEDAERLLPYLSAHTRQASERGTPSRIDKDNWRDLARAHTTTPVSQKVAKLLELIAARSSRPGAVVLFAESLDYPLVDASSPEEVSYLAKHLTAICKGMRPDSHNVETSAGCRVG